MGVSLILLLLMASKHHRSETAQSNIREGNENKETRKKKIVDIVILIKN
jgi:hypothetical protein